MSSLVKNRKFSLDLIRLIATLAVIMIHISVDFVKENDSACFEFVVGNFFNSISRFAVPFFLMISGTFMLKESKNVTSKKMLNSALSYSLILLFWSTAYAIGYTILKPAVFNEPIALENTILAIVKGHYHLWYLYMLIGICLITPILRLFVKKENAKYIKGYLVLSIVVCFCTPIINIILNECGLYTDVYADFIEQFNFGFLNQFVTYYILGWYIAEVGIKKPQRHTMYILGAIGLVATFVMVQFFNNMDIANTVYSTGSINVFLYSVAVYLLLYYKFENAKQTKLTSAVINVSKYTFGMYLIHPVFLFALKMVCDGIANPVLQLFVTFVSAAVLSFVSAFIISKIPLLKKSIKC